MIDIMEKHAIITLKLSGNSNRKIARDAGIDRKTVARYWNEYQQLVGHLLPDVDNRAIQEQITAAPKFDNSLRKPIKYTPQIDEAIDIILENEAIKAREIGDNNKQKLTNRQIHRLIRDQGFDIGITTITNHLKEKRNKLAEAFIRQDYDFGQRLEFDFGEVRLIINGVYRKYYLAVFGSPKSSFRWAYLYKNQQKEVFLNSHVRFFEMVRGVYCEVVYDYTAELTIGSACLKAIYPLHCPSKVRDSSSPENKVALQHQALSIVPHHPNDLRSLPSLPR